HDVPRAVRSWVVSEGCRVVSPASGEGPDRTVRGGLHHCVHCRGGRLPPPGPGSRSRSHPGQWTYEGPGLARSRRRIVMPGRMPILLNLPESSSSVSQRVATSALLTTATGSPGGSRSPRLYAVL